MEIEEMTGTVIAVSCSGEYTFTKPNRESINLLKGLGVEGDAHMGETVQHRSHKARDPHQVNLRQVHLLHCELLDELQAAGFEVYPGAMGENVTTRGVDLLGLPTGTLPRTRHTLCNVRLRPNRVRPQSPASRW